MAVSNRTLLAIIANRTARKPNLDVICNGIIRLVARAEAFDAADADQWLGINLDLIEERLEEIVEIRDALRAAKNGGAS